MDVRLFGAEVLTELPYEANDQQVAVVAALSRFVMEPPVRERAFILNGYAGTGKTSLTGALVRVLKKHKVPLMLLAPTGRAAKVLSNNTGGHRAFTIHRKIYRHNPDGGIGAWGMPSQADNKLTNAVFIVDEASMIGSGDERGCNLLEDLITFVFSQPGNRLILIGDTAQLPPVGSDSSPAMNPAVLKSLGLHVSRAIMTETARQSADSGILFNATRLRRTMAKIRSLSEGEAMPVPKLRLRGFADVRNVSGEDLPEIISDSYASENGVADTIVITRSNRRAAEYNAAIRANVLYLEEEICVGDLLIVSRNHYFGRSIGGVDFVANGDILTVVKVYGTEVYAGIRYADLRLSLPAPDGESDAIEFDIKIILDTLGTPDSTLTQEQWNQLYYNLLSDVGPYATYPPEQRARALRNDPHWTALHVKFAYAITCHKAQGGQWSRVFVDLSYIPADALGLNLYRWLYTAATRARHRLHLITPPQEIIEE